MKIENIYVGYVEEFNYLDKDIKKILSNQPKKGGIYRVLQSKVEKDGEVHNLYQIYIGHETNKAGMDTIFLGDNLAGNYNDKWEYRIKILDKTNFVDFNIKESDLSNLSTWLESDHSDLRDLMNKKPVAVNVTETQVKEETTDKTELVTKALRKVMDFDKDFEDSMRRTHESLNTIISKDPMGFMVMADLLTYVASTHKDKYEAADSPNIAKEFLLNSKSSDVAIFNTFKYLQRYSTQGFEKSGKTIDLHKAIHYILFELQRQKSKND